MSKPYDGGSKYLLEHHGRSLALLGGLTDVISCKSVQSELVHTVQIPDGLLEVKLRGRKEPLPLLIEFCTYPSSQTPGQLMDDVMMVWLARRVLPEVLVFVLCPKGNLEVPRRHALHSEMGWTRGAFEWKVEELWKRSAEEALAMPDVGAVPWAVLMAHEGPPEPLLRRCRERIDKEGGDQRRELLAVTQTLLGLKYQDQKLFDLFGGVNAMIESPRIEQIVSQRERQGQQRFVEAVILARFGQLSDDARARLQGVQEEAKLEALNRFAAVCPSLEAFVERLEAETTPPPAPKSSRRKKKT